MARIAVLDDYQRVAHRFADWSRLGEHEVTFFHEPLDDPAAALEPFEIVCAMRERTAFPAELFDRLSNLRLLVTTGRRNAAIDLGAAARHGVTVCGTDVPGASTAELAWGLILALVRHVPTEDQNVRDGGWQTTVGLDLAGRTLGIVGLGRLGSIVARYGAAFGMRLVAWSENLTAERAAECGAKLVTKDELLSTADVVTIHLVLSGRTRGLIGARELGLMKPTAYIVNTSRSL
jgi:phosphoglycerate dehydrogenase-like enzyme